MIISVTVEVLFAKEIRFAFNEHKNRNDFFHSLWHFYHDRMKKKISPFRINELFKCQLFSRPLEQNVNSIKIILPVHNSGNVDKRSKSSHLRFRRLSSK